MRCRIGDVAVIIGRPGCLFPWKLCTVVEPACDGASDWIIDVLGQAPPVSGRAWGAWDRDLIPIRDQPGEDETLTWAGKPQETPTEIIRRETERVS